MRIAIIFVMLFFCQNIIFGQAMTGTVVGSDKKRLADVQILNFTTQDHTHSDEIGNFMLQNVHIGDTLKFSHIAYEIRYTVVQDLESQLSIVLEEKSLSLDEVVVLPRMNALNLLTDIDLHTNPVNSSQDILRQVPGLFIGQHAGGGKAEQIFLRGFDIDHGTDVGITVDGMPVNMVSHTHGQGYSDLHFIIPETVDKIGFGKGPYYADKGNFNTAGYVDFQTKESLDNSLIRFESGQFKTNRILGMLNLIDEERHSAYVATEYLVTDGPFESSQNFNRLNLLAKYTGNVTSSDKFGVTMSHFTSKWDASGQIPERAVESDLISRFGAIDDTEGGNTSRTNLLVNYDKIIDENSLIKSSVFYNLYDFELYSNFTFFLVDSINGDQIRQKEDRSIFGFRSDYYRSFSLNDIEGTLEAGVNLRNDQSNGNELSNTLNRTQTLNQIQVGDINETNFGSYISASFNFGNWIISPSVRADYFNFQYNDALQSNYQTKAETKTIISPNLNILYSTSNNLQLYLKSGKGFHSNDTRVVITPNGEQSLPAAYGTDLGFIWKPIPKLVINTAYWYLFLEQEFVYVGDAGIVEPSGQTQRQGIDFSLRYQPLKWLFWRLDANYAHARAIEEESGDNYIPLAPDFILQSGLNVIHRSNFYGGLNMRFINDRPANEDYSIVAEGFTVLDLNLGYTWKGLNAEIQIQNLLNTEWNEAQFATESRLRNETAPVEEIHFTPGTPFFLKAAIGYKF